MSDTYTTKIHGEKLNLKAIGDRIVVECELKMPSTFMTSGLLIPQTTQVKMKPSSGTVRAVGPQVTDVHPGDVIHWGVGCGVGVDFNRIRIVRRTDVFATEHD